ncbi:MAG: methyltransferase family protein [Flavobacteriales bacterium]
MSLPSPTICFTLFGISELSLAVFKRSGKGTQSQDRGTLGLLWGVIGASIFLAMFIANGAPRYGYAFSGFAYVVGLLLFIAGVALRWWAIVHLGRFFTVDVAIAKDHRVVSDGPYRFIRHPSYTGALLAFIGLGLLVHNWLAALVLLVPITVMFLWRMNIEERALSVALGEVYTGYMANTKRLIPFVY